MKTSRPVYSTESGRLCPACGHAMTQCVCKAGLVNATGDGIVRVSRETRGRKGKGVTLVTGFRGTEKELKDLSKSLKQLCGTGGTVKNGVIEIQGDQRRKIAEQLRQDGHRVKLAGG